MDGNARSSVNQKKPIAGGIRGTDSDLVELLWHNGSVVAQPQRAWNASGRGGQSTSGVTGEETAAWFPDAIVDDALESDDMYTQLWWHSVATVAPDECLLPGPSAHPTPELTAHQTAMASGIVSSWPGDTCSTFCGSNQVPGVALPSEGVRCASTQDGAGTSSSGGGSGLPSESAHTHKRKKGTRGKDDSDSRSEDAECEATEETKSSRRYASKRRSRVAEVHNMSERKRRDRINEKMRSLQELIPHCNKADKASILDEAIDYLKSLQMQVQIMWMTTGMAPMIFPGGQQFMPPPAMGMNSCMPAAQGLNQMARMPYMNHSMSNHSPMNSSPAMNPLYVANQMQNIHLREAYSQFIRQDGEQTVVPRVPGQYAYASQVAKQNCISEVPGSTVVPTSGARQPTTIDGIQND